mmetsp:Transcript_28394/g.53080  ORF Transcript_28394/g.53080 Transcript_28394/m.53080 type:complete len:251 (-) Transcript_28394:1209-1961(-)
MAASFREALHFHLQRFEVHDVQQCDVGNDCRQERVFDHVDVGNIHVFHHQEGRRSHHRWGQLTVGGGGNFNRASLFSREADTLHQRNREGTCCDGVGNRATRNHPGHHRTQNRGLCRAATQRAKQRNRHFDEPITTTRAIKQRAKQHKQEDHRGRYAERNAKHTFGLHPVMPQRFRQRRTTVVGDVAHPLRIATKEREQHKGTCDYHKRKAQCAVDADKQYHHANGGHCYVCGGPEAGTIRDLVPEYNKI